MALIDSTILYSRSTWLQPALALLDSTYSTTAVLPDSIQTLSLPYFILLYCTLPWFEFVLLTVTLLLSTMALLYSAISLLDSALLYSILAPFHSAIPNHAWLYFIPLYYTLPWLYLTLPHSTIAQLYSTTLYNCCTWPYSTTHYTIALLDSINMLLPYVTVLCFPLSLPFFIYHGSTWLCYSLPLSNFTVLYFAIALLDSLSASYHGSTWLY